MSKNDHLLVVEPKPLRVIHGYSLLEELGRGSFATAYRAMKDGQEYCVREQGIHGLDGRSAVKAIELFRREADVLSGLDHPQIPKVHDYFEETDGGWRFYLVQDLVPGQCLKSVVNPEGENGNELAKPFDEEKVVDVALQLCSILGYLHGRTPPVVHRDVKPSNVMMDEAGKVYLIDFGNVQQELTGIVGGSTMFGTPGFAPLELCVPGRTTPKSDIYMPGTTMLNLASGIDPVQLTDHLRRVDYKGKFRFKNPSLEVLVDQMTQADPENRLESAEQVAGYLEKIKAGKTISKPKEGVGRVSRFLARFLPSEILRHAAATRAGEIAAAQQDRTLIVSDQGIVLDGNIEVLNGEAKIEKTDVYWTFYNVPLFGRGGEEGVLRFTRGLLFDGQSLGQEEYVRRLQGSELVLPTVPEYLSLAAYLKQGKDHPVPEQKKVFEEVKAWLGKMFKDYWLMTGTRSLYHPDGTGKVIQGVGRKGSFSIDVPALVGPDGWIKDMGNQKATIKALCGTGDTALVNQSFRDVSGKNSYLWHINDNPSQQEERPVALGIGLNGRFVIGASNVVSIGRALGVVTQRENFLRGNKD